MMLHSLKKILTIIFGLFAYSQISAQTSPRGYFLSDTIEIGKAVQFALSFRHLPDQDIFFPDTTAQFSPFEIRERTFFSTRTEKKMSLDSVVYTLVSFDTHPIQKLTLPVYLYNKQDCTAVYCPVDSVFLHEVVQNTDSPIKTINSFLPLATQFDYLNLLLVLALSSFVVFMSYLVFGKSIKRQIQILKFNQEHKHFLSEYRKILKADIDSSQIGNALTLWKKYIGKLEGGSFESFTTKELIDNLPDENLENALKELDMAAYGGVLSVNTPAAMRFLQSKAIEIYEKNKRVL